MRHIRTIYSRVIRNSDDLDKLVTTLGFVAGACLVIAYAIAVKTAI